MTDKYVYFISISIYYYYYCYCIYYKLIEACVAFVLQRSMKPESTPACLKDYSTVSVQHVYFVDPLKITCA